MMVTLPSRNSTGSEFVWAAVMQTGRSNIGNSRRVCKRTEEKRQATRGEPASFSID